MSRVLVFVMFGTKMAKKGNGKRTNPSGNLNLNLNLIRSDDRRIPGYRRRCSRLLPGRR